MNLVSPPEVADGGYWYAVPVLPDPELGGKTPGDIPGAGWCAWYSGGYAVVRTPDPVEVSEAVWSVLPGEPKLFGRVGGR